jgi:2,4-dichlorophenol 6-monooxygenase
VAALTVSPVETPVLVVGAGPAGMMTSLLLSRLGIPSRVVERRDGPLTAPAAHVVNARTFEIFRAAGFDMRALADACEDPADAGTVRWVTTLAGKELGRLPFERQGDDTLAVTPTPLRNLSQHRLEPLLLDELRRCRDVEIAHGHEWLDAEQDATGTTSHVRDHTTGRGYQVRSRWLVAADGAASRIRKHLGIELVGPDRLQSFVMIHFEANLRPLVRQRPGILYWTTAPGATGTLVAHSIDSTWVYMHPWDPDRESAADYTEDVCRAIVRRALGTDDYPFSIRTIRSWMMTAQIAERYRRGRALLVGDAAHRFPPSGGLGLNTGVQDAHNLAWKIAAVEAGWAAEALLDTYDVERRPVAEHNAEVSLENALRLGEVYQAVAAEDAVADFDAPVSDAVRTAIANQAEHFDMLGLQLGFTYRCGAILANGDAASTAAAPVREYRPSAVPGARVPHAWVTRGGDRISTLDLFSYDRFTVISGPAARGWQRAAVDGVPIEHVVIGLDVSDEDGHWMRLLGIDDDGAVLVRPDQHVAWRSRHGVADAAGALEHALATVLARCKEPR